MREEKKEAMRSVGLGTHVDLIDQGKCPLCSKKIEEKDFRDRLSKKEFDISGFCQKCQGRVFRHD